MKVSNFQMGRLVFYAMIGVLGFCVLADGQSRDQNFPTSVSSSEISGIINPRDMGDSRLTTYYYAFDGRQGDIFINVVTKNFTGDIDVYTRDTQRPLTKIVIYADSGSNETGRLIYLRKEENLLLRIQGRTPNDDVATFRIKFAGSFVALQARKDEEAPVIEPETARGNTVVNSVGTIKQDQPKALPAKEIPVVPEKLPETESASPVAEKRPETEPSKTASKPEVVVESTIKEPATIFGKRPERRPQRVSGGEKKADPMAGFRLMILMKDGTQIERPMTDVLRFSVDKGVLTVIAKNGAVAKYSIVDVTRVTIE